MAAKARTSGGKSVSSSKVSKASEVRKAQPAFRNPALPIEERVKDLIGRMTLAEKIGQMGSGTPAIPRLGIPQYSWHNECLHGLCHTGKATVFPAAVAMAATFDAPLVEGIAGAIADEARAKHHDKLWYKSTGPRVGINFWTPVVNLVRDARWGRGQEAYGEDPHLAGAIGAAFVRGLQGDNPRYMKTAACAKHFAVHSGPESIRGGFDARVSLKDLHESYLPAFKMLVDAGVETVMAAYNRVNGEACCGSMTLLTEILRNQWGFKGHVVSDGGAVQGMHGQHHVTANAMESGVLAVKTGCDMDNSHPTTFTHLGEALDKGLVTMAEIDRCLGRIMATRIKLGMFDEPARVPYTKIKSSVIQSKKHIELARKSAVESVVMLKNNGILPLKPELRTVNVIGPNAADVQLLLGNFYRGVTANAVTILEGIVAEAPEGVAVTHMQGCYAAHPNLSNSNWAVGLAQWSDAIVAVMGITTLMEGEGGECIGSPDGDRLRLELPDHQMKLLRKIKEEAPNRPLIVVVTGGSPVAMPEVHEMADAVLFAWYGGEQGGTAVGQVIFGKESPSGRLPISFPMATDDLPPFEDYSMAGRTYRYATTKPLYPFGFGLSYTKFKYGKAKVSARRVKAGQAVTVEATVTNTGKVAADEVVQLYITDDKASTYTPLNALKDFHRVNLDPGQTAMVKFTVTPEMMALINDDGKPVIEPGTFTAHVASSCPSERSRELGAPAPVTAKWEVTE